MIGQDLLEWLDSVVDGTVLIFGRLPPEGRDLDLLARPAELDAITANLRRKNFLNVGRQWVRFRECEAQAVELVAAQSWNLPPAERDALFEEAVPLDGFRRLARPAPHHALLIGARRLAEVGELSEREREALRQTEARDADCWALAQRRAALWRAEGALRDLRARVQTGQRQDGVRRVARRRRQSTRLLRAALPGGPRGRVVSISGCDGAGKSSQARALQRALDTVGIEAVVVWRPLGDFVVLDFIGTPVKKLLRLLRVGPFRDHEVRSVMSTGSDSSGAGSAMAKNVWLTAVALLNALSQRWAVAAHTRRGRLVILDRGSLDAMVLLRFLYGKGHSFRFQRWLLRTLSAPVSLGFLLDVPPEMLLARKLDWWSLDDLRHQVDLYREEHIRFGVRRLDGELPEHEICTLIAAEAWNLVTARGDSALSTAEAAASSL